MSIHKLLDLDMTVINRMKQFYEAVEHYQKLLLASRWGDLIQHASRLGGLAEVILHQIRARSVIGEFARVDLATQGQIFSDTLRHD